MTPLCPELAIELSWACSSASWCYILLHSSLNMLPRSCTHQLFRPQSSWQQSLQGGERRARQHTGQALFSDGKAQT